MITYISVPLQLTTVNQEPTVPRTFAALQEV